MGLGGECQLRMSTAKLGPVLTDNGNFIIDWKFPHPVRLDAATPNGRSDGQIFHEEEKDVETDWGKVDALLHSIPGLLETGLFVNMTTAVVSADDHGNYTVDYSKAK